MKVHSPAHARGQSPLRQVVLCDARGARVGIASVSEVHDAAGMLHKAFSIFVFRQAGAEVLLQLRSPHKRLFPLRWANTCCSHVSPSDTDIPLAGMRRLHEELGFSVALSEAGAFVYRAHDLHAQCSEYEHDTVLVGHLREAVSIRPDPAEVAECKWVETGALHCDVRAHPDDYAPWLREALSLAVRDVPHP